MKIALLVKYCPDSEAQIEVESGKLAISGVKFSVSPYDEYGSEEALKLVEKFPDSEIVLISVGPEANSKGLKDELARGAHRAIHVIVNDEHPSSELVAKSIGAVIVAEKPDLILAGWKGIDFDQGVTGTQVAEILGYSHVALVTSFEIDGNKAVCRRQVDGGEEVVEVVLPAVITTQKGPKEPRYPTLKGIMAAKKKTIENKTLQDLGVANSEPSVVYTSFSKPPAKQAGKVFDGAESVAEVVRLLREEAKVI